MALPGQKQGLLQGNLMAGFDSQAYCAYFRDKGKSTDPCIKHEDCQFYNLLTLVQKTHLSPPSKEKGET